MKNNETLSISSAITNGMPVVLLGLLDDYTLMREDGLRGSDLSNALLSAIIDQQELPYPQAVQALNDTAKFYKFSLDA